MFSLLKTKLALLVQTKVGVALVGAVVVAGGGTAVAVTAAHNGLGPLGSTISGPSASSTENEQGDSNDQGKNHVSAEGILLAVKGNTITVKTKDKGTLTFIVDAHTRINGEGDEQDAHDAHTAQPEKTEQPEATEQPEQTGEANGTKQPEATDKPEATEQPEHGGHVLTLADLAKAVNHKVQVQGVKQSNNTLLATKVTIQGAGDKQESGSNKSDGTHVPEGTTTTGND